jgi:CBS domain-containing protein
MHCTVCGFENYIGSDVCENCGAELATGDVPQATTSFHGRLLGTHLDELGVGDPVTIAAAEAASMAIALMHADGSDCVLVTQDGRLVGIFTDRDAVLKVKSGADEARPIRDLMTPDPVVLRHDDPIAVAINKMAVGGFRHIPIVEDGRPTGVVAARDVFRHIAQRLG